MWRMMSKCVYVGGSCIDNLKKRVHGCKASWVQRVKGGRGGFGVLRVWVLEGLGCKEYGVLMIWGIQ